MSPKQNKKSLCFVESPVDQIGLREHEVKQSKQYTKAMIYVTSSLQRSSYISRLSPDNIGKSEANPKKSW